MTGANRPEFDEDLEQVARGVARPAHLTLPPDLAARLAVVATAKGCTVDVLVTNWLTRRVEIAEAATRIREAAVRAREAATTGAASGPLPTRGRAGDGVAEERSDGNHTNKAPR